MKLHLLRHAEAEERATGDRSRRLTPKGEEQAAKVGGFCLRHGIEPEVILSSPVIRARQTADAVAARLTGAELIEAPWAACGMRTETFCGEIAAYKNFSSVMLVGHQPDLGLLAAWLLGVEEGECLHVRKALLMGLEVSSWVAGGSRLEFFVPVKLM
jgi:phosphohistidine phosphatase